MTRVVAIILAAGSGERMGRAEPKAFLPLGPVSMLEQALRNAAACQDVDSLVVALPASAEASPPVVDGLGKQVAYATGGKTRQASVVAALAAVPGETEIVVCHDAARPFATANLFSSVIGALGRAGDEGPADGAIPVLPIADTVKKVRDGVVVGTEPRSDLFAAQTPQAFLAVSLRAAHERATAEGFAATDDAAVVEWAGYRVVTVAGEPENLKVTTPLDLARAEAIVSAGGALS